MDWNEMGAIGSLGSFLVAGLLFAIQVWPVPQWRAKSSSSATPLSTSSNRLTPRPIGIFLILGFLLVGVSIYGSWHPLEPIPIQITTGNVEQNLRVWLDDFNLGVRVVPDQSDYFRLDVSMPNGNARNFEGITIARPRNREQYLVFGVGLVFTPEQKLRLSHLSEEQYKYLLNSVDLDLARINIHYETQLPNGIILNTAIPITSDLNENDVMRTVQSITSALAVAEASLAVNTARITGKVL